MIILEILAFLLAILFAGEGFCSERLSGKLIVGVKGGPCYSLGGDISSDEGAGGRYGVGLSAEYFILEPFSAGLTLVYNSFDGEWRRSGYYIVGPMG
jgi:hypothetical protein